MGKKGASVGYRGCCREARDKIQIQRAAMPTHTRTHAPTNDEDADRLRGQARVLSAAASITVRTHAHMVILLVTPNHTTLPMSKAKPTH